MSDRDQEKRADQQQTRSLAAPKDGHDEPDSAGTDAAAVGNAGMDARSRRGTALPAAPSPAVATEGLVAPMAEDDVEHLLYAESASGPEIVSAISIWARKEPRDAVALAEDDRIEKYASVLSGEEMAEVLNIIRSPARGNGRVVRWLKAIYKADVEVGGTPDSTYLNLIAGASEADLAQLFQKEHASLLTVVFEVIPLDPLTIFPATQAGLTPEAAASADFVTELVARASDNQIWRAVRGTGAASLRSLATNLNAVDNGWGWLARLDSAGFSAGERALLSALQLAANSKGQAIISTANAFVGTATPTVPFLTAFDTLKAADVAPTAQALRALLQTGSTAERTLVLTDAAKASWVFGILKGHPFAELSVEGSTRGDFLAVPSVFGAFFHTPMQWRERLQVLSDRSYISRIAENLISFAGAIMNWIEETLPEKYELSVPDELDLRAIGLVTGHAGIEAVVAKKFDDKHKDEVGTKTAAATPASVYEMPLSRLDSLLTQPATPLPEILSIVGALASSPDRDVLISDAARMTRLRGRLDPKRFFEAVVALRLSLDAGLTQLRQKAHSPAYVQSLIASSTANERNLAITNDANVVMVRAALPDAPLLLLFDGGLNPETLAYAAWRTWVLEATPIQQLLPRLGADASTATAAARQLDAANAWDFLARIPAAPALSAPEKTALGHLLSATTSAAARASLRALTEATPGLTPSRPKEASTPEGDGQSSLPKTADAASAATLNWQLFEAEIQSTPVNAARLIQRVTELSPSDRDLAMSSHQSRIVTSLSGQELARFVDRLNLTLSQKLDWLRVKGNEVPHSELLALIARAPFPERITLFDSIQHVSQLNDNSALGPFQAVAGLEAKLPILATKEAFWWWVGRRCTPLDTLKYIATSGSIAASLAHLAAVGFAKVFDNLPRGAGLSALAQGHLDTIMASLKTQLSLARDIFSIRFDLALTGSWAAADVRDIASLYDESRHLPIAHIANNPKLKIFNRGSEGPSTYAKETNQVHINEAAVDGEQKNYSNPKKPPITERAFDHTVRHEIGHSVDALLGHRTSLVYGLAGWKEYGIGELDQWIQNLDGWNPNGGARPTDDDKQQIRDLILRLLQSGGGSIDGPRGAIADIAPADHPWKTLTKLKIVKDIDHNAGTLPYTKRIKFGGKTFSINYYY